MNYQFQRFTCSSLSNYEFSMPSSEYLEQMCGYDQWGNSWRGETLLALREQKLIVKECPEKTVVMGREKALLGYIRAGFDDTWLVHSSYFFGNMDGMEVSGFRNEFYAVRYLHEVMNAAFPSIVFDPLPTLLWDMEKLILERPRKEILLENLDATLGYIQKCDEGVWLAYSYYYPRSMNEIKAIGFISEAYAIRYLYQIAEARFPNMIESIPELP